MFVLRPTPVDLSRSAVSSLPRWALLALLTAFIVPGFWGHAIWTNDMGQAFGEIWTMLQGGSWLLPQAAGADALEHGPLPAWIGAFFVHCFGSLVAPTTAARMAGLLYFSLASVSVWYGTWFLARRQEAQPVHQAFGRSPTSRDFARLVADAATLFFVSFFGLIIRLHDPSPENAAIAFCALAFLGSAWSLQKPYKGVTLSALAIAGVFFSVGVSAALAALIACTLVQVGLAKQEGRKSAMLLALLWLIAICCSLLWPLAAFQTQGDAAAVWFASWLTFQSQAFSMATPADWVWFLEKCIWYLFPVWPFAIFAVWSWRRNWRSPFVLLPISFLFAWFLIFLASPANRATDLLCVIVVPLSTLAAFGLMSMRNSARSFLAFFSVGVYSLALLALWAYWGAWVTGFPPKMAHSIIRLAPSAEAFSTGLGALILVVGASMVWFYFAFQRLVHRPEVRWTGPWLAALGMTTVWIAAFFLFRPSFEAARSYESMAVEMRAQILTWKMDPAKVCLRTKNVPTSIGAQIAYYGQLALTPSYDCALTLQRDRADHVPLQSSLVFKRPHTNEVFYLERP